MSDTDLQLIARYARHHSEDAFAELVRRYLDFVHSAALRQVRSPDLAEDVAQSVFTDLARQAHMLPPNTIVPAWLYQVTRRTAIDVVRREISRKLREQSAQELQLMNATASDWTHIEPILDEAMHSLEETDRAAVLLRYFENKSLREVGRNLGTSDDAAQKRVSRAVEHLREFLTKCGISIGASGLSAVVSANAVQAAPIGLSAAITAAALTGTTMATATVPIATKIIAMTVLRKSLVASLVVVGVGTALIVQHQASQSLRAENAALRQQTNQIAELEQLRLENQELAKLRAQSEELVRLRTDHAELLRLRGEVGLLRQRAAEAPRSEPPRNLAAIPTNVPVEPSDFPPRTISFTKFDAIQVLTLFSDIAGLELDLAPLSAAPRGKITFENDRALTRAEVLAVLEQVLRDQAGYVVKRTTPEHATVIFDGSVMQSLAK